MCRFKPDQSTFATKAAHHRDSRFDGQLDIGNAERSTISDREERSYRDY